MKTFVIDGNNFNDWEGFTKELYSQFGANWFAFNVAWLEDILYGGVVGFDYAEEITFIWKNNLKSKTDLNKETHVHMNEDVRKEYGGLYEYIITLLRDHSNIHLQLDSDNGQHNLEV